MFTWHIYTCFMSFTHMMRVMCSFIGHRWSGVCSLTALCLHGVGDVTLVCVCLSIFPVISWQWHPAVAAGAACWQQNFINTADMNTQMTCYRELTSCSVRRAMVWSRLLSSSLSCCTSCKRAWTWTHAGNHVRKVFWENKFTLRHFICSAIHSVTVQSVAQP